MGVRDRENINIWVAHMSPDLALLVLTVAVGPRKPLKNKNKNQKNPQISGAQDHT